LHPNLSDDDARKRRLQKLRVELEQQGYLTDDKVRTSVNRMIERIAHKVLKCHGGKRATQARH